MRWLYDATQNNGKLGWLKGCGHLKQWMHRHGYAEARGYDAYITAKGRQALADAIAAYDRHGRLPEALPGDRPQVVIDHAHCKVCEQDEKRAWEEWRAANPPTKEQQRAHDQLMWRMMAGSAGPRAIYVHPDVYAAMKQALKGGAR
jgi:hypothetical protein